VLHQARVDGSHTEEGRLVRKDGNTIRVAVMIAALLGDSGAPTGFAVAIHAAERHRDEDTRDGPEDALRVCEARYRTLFDHSQVGIVVADTKSFYTDANPSMCRMLGYTRDEMIGLHASDIIAPQEVEQIEPALSEIHRRSDHRREWHFRRKDGSVFPADVIATRVPDGTLIGMIRDLSDRKRADDYRERLAAIVESSPDAIIGTDLDGVVTSWNAGAEAIFGFPADEIVGAPIARLIPDEERWQDTIILEKLRRGECVEPFETLRNTADGRLIDVSVSASPIRNASGQIVGGARIVRDITALKQREREIARLSRLYAALSQINQAIVWTPNRDELFRKVCRALVKDAGYRMAWIGWHDPATQRIVPVAEYGDEGGYLRNISVYSDERPEGRGQSGTAFRSGRPVICNDALNDIISAPWRPELVRCNFRAIAAFPVRFRGAVCGIIHVYADQTGFFRDKEVALLDEAATDLSFALDNFERDEEKRQAEQTLRSEKQFSDTMIESMPGILYFYDRNGRFLRWNRNFETVSGYSGAEIARMHPIDFFAGADRARVEQRIAHVFTQGESSVEAEFVAKDGTATPYFFTGRRVEFEGRPCLVGVGIDISDRRRAEARVAESERKYRELVENANSIILRWNTAGRVTFLNEFGQRFFGYTAEEIVGRHVTGTIVPPTESGGRDLRQLMDELCADPQAFEQNVNENIRRNGQRVWIAWTNRIVRDDAGRAVEFLSVGTDITERRQAETALREAELRFHTLFEQTPAGVAVLDPDTASIVECNELAAQQLGYTVREFCRLEISDIEANDTREEIHRRIGRLLAEGRIQFETRHRTKSGEVRDVFVSGRLVELSGRMVIHCVFLDVTERKQAEVEREMRHRAEAADRIKSAFLATMSHELRTPLNSIIGFTGIILQGLAGPLNDEQNKQLAMVRTSARHLLALVNDVLDISKIEAGQLEVARESFDVCRSVAKVLTLVSPQAKAKGLELCHRVAPGLGEAVSDERRFEQILLNLLSNAVKFTDRGEITVVVERVAEFRLSGVESPQPAVRVQVSDTGMGIKPDDLVHLFQPFRQIDSGLSRNHDGTGLGLAICHRLAALMGGEIGVESQWGKGSTFSVTLPLHGPVKT
jgi:PAS domain S-box-containing protein